MIANLDTINIQNNKDHTTKGQNMSTNKVIQDKPIEILEKR